VSSSVEGRHVKRSGSSKDMPTGRIVPLPVPGPARYDALLVCLDLPTDLLDARLDRRVAAMVVEPVIENGGFGSKAIINGPQILAILAARMTGRPVKLMLRRDQMFGPTGHRGATRQRLRIGVDAQSVISESDEGSVECPPPGADV
jgi:hypothetical protein